MADYKNKKLNLANDYLFVGFYDQPTNNVMGKIIKVKGQDKGKSWKPANITTAFLLYLLCREDNDHIPYEEFTQLIYKKFDNVPEGAIEALLDTLLVKGALQDNGTNFAGPADPLGACDGPKLNWEEPALMVSQGANCKEKHHYSPGYIFITIGK